MRNRFTDHVRLIVLFTLIYVILNENLSVLTVSLGIISGSVAIWLTNKILDIDYVEMFHINLWLILTYFWIIIRDSYVAGFQMTIRIFKNTIEPNYIKYCSRLNDEFLTVLLANAITMPPGTIVVDRDSDEMMVLTMGLEEKSFVIDTYEQIERLFEKFDTKEEES